jgi:D-aminopeptidase
LSHQLFWYLVVGGLTVVVDIGLLALLHEAYGVPLGLATTVAFCTAVAMNFLLNRTAMSSRGSQELMQHAFRYGSLVLANYGQLPQLVLAGQVLGARLAAYQAQTVEPEKGSIILLIATDAPLDARQLRRLALRAGAGLARTGSVFGHGSGDIALAFSTAYTVPQQSARPMPGVAMLHDGLIDPLFQAVADSTEQAILHALWQARAVTGRGGHHRNALHDLLPDWPSSPSSSSFPPSPDSP